MAKTKHELHGIVCGPSIDDKWSVLSACTLLLCEESATMRKLRTLRPGVWVNFTMDTETGVNTIVEECKAKFPTTLYDDETFEITVPVARFIACTEEEENMVPDCPFVFNPYFRWVADPDSLIQNMPHLEWYMGTVTASHELPALRLTDIHRRIPPPQGSFLLPFNAPTASEIRETWSLLGDPKTNPSLLNAMTKAAALCIGFITIEERTEQSGKYGNRGGYGRGGYDNHRGGGYGNHRGYGGSRGDAGGNWRSGGGESDGGVRTEPRMQPWTRGRGRGKQVWVGGPGHAKGGVLFKLDGYKAEQGGMKRWLLLSSRYGLVTCKSLDVGCAIGDWVKFEKIALDAPDTPPRVLQPKTVDPPLLRTRVLDPAENAYSTQIFQTVELRWMRELTGGWFEPMIGEISCPTKLYRMAVERLEEVDPSWSEKNDDERMKTRINVWVGLDAHTLKVAEKFYNGKLIPTRFKWTVQHLAEEDFMYDPLYQIASKAGALPTIVL